jgi:hypothetical protein
LMKRRIFVIWNGNDTVGMLVEVRLWVRTGTKGVAAQGGNHQTFLLVFLSS